ncbi:kinase kinase kinase [Aureococcus anophagefferens]|nr:kinase kinase kinase [Aureococcus anophagefferens]
MLFAGGGLEASGAQLLAAAGRGDAARVGELLEACRHAVHFRDEEGRTALHHAAAADAEACVALLLPHQPALPLRSERGDTALHAAAAAGAARAAARSSRTGDSTRYKRLGRDAAPRGRGGGRRADHRPPRRRGRETRRARRLAPRAAARRATTADVGCVGALLGADDPRIAALADDDALAAASPGGPAAKWPRSASPPPRPRPNLKPRDARTPPGERGVADAHAPRTPGPPPPPRRPPAPPKQSPLKPLSHAEIDAAVAAAHARAQGVPGAGRADAPADEPSAAPGAPADEPRQSVAAAASRDFARRRKRAPDDSSTNLGKLLAYRREDLARRLDDAACVANGRDAFGLTALHKLCAWDAADLLDGLPRLSAEDQMRRARAGPRRRSHARRERGDGRDAGDVDGAGVDGRAPDDVRLSAPVAWP